MTKDEIFVTRTNDGIIQAESEKENGEYLEFELFPNGDLKVFIFCPDIEKEMAFIFSKDSILKAIETGFSLTKNK